MVDTSSASTAAAPDLAHATDRVGDLKWRCVFLLAAVLAAAPGCLVLSLNPVYDDESLGWEPRLVGGWTDADDNVSLEIERGEWKSYRIKYVHPIETGELTGYLTAIDDERYLNVMPLRGEDRGSFLIPAHATVRIRVDADRLEVTPLSYDWFFDRLRGAHPIPGLSVVLDHKENALIVSPTPELRSWLRVQPTVGAMFGAATVFSRKPAEIPKRPVESDF